MHNRVEVSTLLQGILHRLLVGQLVFSLVLHLLLVGTVEMFKSLRVIQEISRRLDEALSHHFQIMIATQPCLTETLGKILGKGGGKNVERNVVENDGFGNAQSNMRHHAQARFTEYFLKEGEHNPINAKTRRPATPFLFNHISVGFHVFCRRRHVKPHLFLWT